MNINKQTHKPYRTELFAPVMKEADGKYIAVLSDDSVDRDEEKCSKGCIEKLGLDTGYIAGLIDHENSVMKQVAEWTNRNVIEIDGHTALVAEPKFFKSNPNAKIIKGMLDEGAKLGISIGAMVKNYDEVDGMRVFTELELLEASFVAIPSNRHGRAMAVAKSFNNKNIKEVQKMDEQEINKKVEVALEKQAEEMKADLEKQMTTKDAEITKLKEDLQKSEEAGEAAKEAAGTDKVAAEKKLEEATAELEKTKKEALEKQKFADQGGNEGEEGTSEEDVNKAFEAGKLPIIGGTKK